MGQQGRPLGRFRAGHSSPTLGTRPGFKRGTEGGVSRWRGTGAGEGAGRRSFGPSGVWDKWRRARSGVRAEVSPDVRPSRDAGAEARVQIISGFERARALYCLCLVPVLLSLAPPDPSDSSLPRLAPGVSPLFPPDGSRLPQDARVLRRAAGAVRHVSV